MGFTFLCPFSSVGDAKMAIVTRKVAALVTGDKGKGGK